MSFLLTRDPECVISWCVTLAPPEAGPLVAQYSQLHIRDTYKKAGVLHILALKGEEVCYISVQRSKRDRTDLK